MLSPEIACSIRKETASAAEKSFAYIDDNAAPTTDHIRMVTLEHKPKISRKENDDSHGCHLQNTNSPCGANKNSSMTLVNIACAYIYRLKRIANRNQIAIIALAQLFRVRKEATKTLAVRP